MKRRNAIGLAILAAASILGWWAGSESHLHQPMAPDTLVAMPSAIRRHAGFRSIPEWIVPEAKPAAAKGKTGFPALDYIHPYLPNLKSRPEGEWQGMPIDLAAMPPCETSGHCGLARACIEATCTACSHDADCLGDEVCSMDHCVRRTLSSCRSSDDCDQGVQCILTGYSSDPRGNSEMESFCLDGARMKEQPTVSYPPEAFVSGPSRAKDLTAFIEGKE